MSLLYEIFPNYSSRLKKKKNLSPPEVGNGKDAFATSLSYYYVICEEFLDDYLGFHLLKISRNTNHRNYIFIIIKWLRISIKMKSSYVQMLVSFIFFLKKIVRVLII